MAFFWATILVVAGLGGLLGCRFSHIGPKGKETLLGLSVWSLFFGIAFAFAGYVSSCEAKDAQAARDAMYLKVRNSGSSDPSSYFQELGNSFIEACKTASWGCGKDDKLSIERDPYGKFILSLSSDLGAVGPDLGDFGKEKATKITSALVWASGHQIRNVVAIRMHLYSADANGASVLYETELIPRDSLDVEWSDPSDAGLTALVGSLISVQSDTASGHIWKEVPIH